MIIRRSAERGYFDHGWLKSHHSFSFGEYRDPNWMGFRALRVINEDVIAPGAGFPPHSHRDMEIITFILRGALAHQDSLGSGSTIRPGQLQGMRAGSGITHSEFNASTTEDVHLMQIWLLPNQRGLAPAYAELPTADLKPNHWSLVASPDLGENRLHIASDAQLFIAPLEAGQTLAQPHTKYPYRWLHVATGEVVFNGETLKAGDAAALQAHDGFSLTASNNSQVLLFDLG
jgi:redox-sensitive bicupin YhaK (pirin superfamily)